MIRILHIVSSLNINAGVMSVIMNYYRYINKSKIQFDFLYFTEMEQNHQKEIQTMGGKCYKIDKPSFSLQFQKSLDCFFQEHQGEWKAIHCHMIYAPEIFSFMAKKNGINHVIVHSHNTKFSDKKISAVRNRILNYFVGWNATEYMACSPEAAMVFGKKRVKNNRVTILKNAIECEKFQYSERMRSEIRTEFGISENVTLIGNIGRLCIQKNQSFLLGIFQEYLKINNSAKLMIVGDGELREKLKNRAKELNLQQSVIFTGKRNDVPALLSAIDVFVMPSIFEGAPVSGVEAQVSGLRCLFSDSITTSVNEINCCYLSLKESPAVWAKKINELKCSIEDREKAYSKMIKSGWNITDEAKKLEKYYISLF